MTAERDENDCYQRQKATPAPRIRRGTGKSRRSTVPQSERTRYCRHVSRLCECADSLEVEGAADSRQRPHALFHRPSASFARSTGKGFLLRSRFAHLIFDVPVRTVFSFLIRLWRSIFDAIRTK